QTTKETRQIEAIRTMAMILTKDKALIKVLIIKVLIKVMIPTRGRVLRTINRKVTTETSGRMINITIMISSKGMEAPRKSLEEIGRREKCLVALNSNSTIET